MKAKAYHKSCDAKTRPGQVMGVSLVLDYKNGRYFASWKGYFKREYRKHFPIGKLGYTNAYKNALKYRESVTGEKHIQRKPPSLTDIQKQLRERIGPDWKSLLSPPLKEWI